MENYANLDNLIAKTTLCISLGDTKLRNTRQFHRRHRAWLSQSWCLIGPERSGQVAVDLLRRAHTWKWINQSRLREHYLNHMVRFDRFTEQRLPRPQCLHMQIDISGCIFVCAARRTPPLPAHAKICCTLQSKYLSKCSLWMMGKAHGERWSSASIFAWIGQLILRLIHGLLCVCK